MQKEAKHKIIKSGKTLELFVLIQNKKGQQRKPRKNPSNRLKAGDSEIRLDNVLRSKSTLKRLIRSNPDLTKFITLTFKENLKDIKKANKIFQNFIKLMNRKYDNFKYIAVPEFQKRGAVHYHLICNVKGFIDNQEISKVWKNGFINIKDLKEGNIDFYLSKYLTKDIDNRLFGHRRYLNSVNCIKPTVYKNVDFMDVNNLVNHLKLIYQYDFAFDWGAELRYYMYSIPENLLDIKKFIR